MLFYSEPEKERIKNFTELENFESGINSVKVVVKHLIHYFIVLNTNLSLNY